MGARNEKNEKWEVWIPMSPHLLIDSILRLQDCEVTMISAVRARESKEIFKFGDESKKLSESDFIAQINNRNAQYFACTMVILKFKFS